MRLPYRIRQEGRIAVGVAVKLWQLQVSIKVDVGREFAHNFTMFGGCRRVFGLVR